MPHGHVSVNSTPAQIKAALTDQSPYYGRLEHLLDLVGADE
jgi:hypothetical protein